MQGGDEGREREERNEFKVKCVGFIFSRRRRSKDSVRAKGRSGRLSGFQRVGMSAAGLAFPRLSGGYSSKVQTSPGTYRSVTCTFSTWCILGWRTASNKYAKMPQTAGCVSFPLDFFLWSEEAKSS